MSGLLHQVSHLLTLLFSQFDAIEHVALRILRHTARKLTAVVLASAMALSVASAGAKDATTIDEMHHGGLPTGSMTQNPQSHMFG